MYGKYSWRFTVLYTQDQPVSIYEGWSILTLKHSGFVEKMIFYKYDQF